MHVLFKSPHAEAIHLRDHAVQRLRFALRRLTSLVPRAIVQLSDVNGPRGGIDKRCQVRLETEGTGTVVVEAVAANWRDALDRALARATRFLVRRGQREQRGQQARLGRRRLAALADNGI